MSGDAPAWRRHLRPSLRDLEAYHVPSVDALARLHANECPEPWPAEVMADIAERVAAIDLGRYPDRTPLRLRARLAERHGCRPEEVILGNGSDEIIALLLAVLSGDGERPSAILLPSPTFVMYELSAHAIGLQIIKVPLDQDLELDGPAMRRALRERAPALVFLARPNNPTSSLWDRRLIMELVAEHPATVFVIDEAYIAYAPGESLWRADRPDNYVHMGTLSKVGLAAIRVGYCVAPPALAAALEQVRPPYNIPEPSAVIAEAILERHGDVQAAMIERTIANRDRLAAILGRLPGAHLFPARANIVLARLDPPAAAPRLREALAARGILIKDVSGLAGLSGCVRVSVGTAAELDLLEAALADLDPAIWSER
ncbi:MAG: aminotransferase class I/II-fold pyridoxal phosphate-dependent enzyme [Myxococcales bacterium]|nr:aminotransferase class I/II-fold pyridoxal phosphate-dependent enzyme [Myxococcales bacterium]